MQHKIAKDSYNGIWREGKKLKHYCQNHEDYRNNNTQGLRPAENEKVGNLIKKPINSQKQLHNQSKVFNLLELKYQSFIL